jgi:hypothetical protein
MAQDFPQELAVYNANLIELLAYPGRFVVIRGHEIHGPFASLDQAWRAGRLRYGAVPFLVKQIQGDTAAAVQAS